MSFNPEKIKKLPEIKLLEELHKYETKRWQEKRNPKNVELSIETMNKYRVYYNDILQINSEDQINTENKSMGVEQLTEPFISLGLANSKEEVNEMIDLVDDDKSGRIEFNEFCNIIQSKSKKQSSSNNQKITKFFQDLAKNDFSREFDLSHFSFKTVMNILRRQNLLKAFLSNDPEQRKEGEKILKAYTDLVQEKKPIKKPNRFGSRKSLNYQVNNLLK